MRQALMKQLLLLIVVWFSPLSPLMAQPYDILIRNGRVIDGSGNPWFYADVGIVGDRIARVGRISAGASAKKVIDASGLYVVPGFIDMHSHSDFSLLVDGRAMSKVTQGVTTEVLGENGSAGPVVGEVAVREIEKALDRFQLELTWRSLGDYFRVLEYSGAAVNIASYVGAGQLRRSVMGFKQGEASPEELAAMKRLLAEAMDDGAIGLSSGLIYIPGRYATTEELIELARVVAERGGIYATHIRSEGAELLAAIDEAIRIGAEAGLPVEIFHFKAAGPSNWSLMPQAIARIDSARAAGIDIAANIYPYVASSTGLDARFPAWVRAGGSEAFVARLEDPEVRTRVKDELAALAESYGGPRAFGESVLVALVFQPQNKRWEGKTLWEIAQATGKDVFDALIDLEYSERGRGLGIYFSMLEDNIRLKLKQPWVSIGSDGTAVTPDGILGQGKPHPRYYGSFPRVLAKYVRDERVIPLEDAIRKMTSLPAQRLGLRNRGLLREGYFADVVVFDFARIQDRSRFDDPHHYSEGIVHSIVNGRLVLDEGKHTGATPGRVLKPNKGQPVARNK
jgi:dihydroorotase/N-acyl-D-amino-acid deacylase